MSKEYLWQKMIYKMRLSVKGDYVSCEIMEIVCEGIWCAKGNDLWMEMMCKGKWCVKGNDVWREMMCEGKWCVKGDAAWREMLYEGRCCVYYVNYSNIERVCTVECV